MKKITILVVAVAAIVMGACNGRPTASLKSESDTVSYAVGQVIGSSLKQMMTYRMGVDTAYINDVLRGVQDGVKVGNDTSKIAYVIGMQLGMQLEQQMKGVGGQITGNDSIPYGDINTCVAAYIMSATGDTTMIMNVEEANKYVMDCIQSANDRRMEEEFGANKKAGEDFMAEVAKREGVKELGDGVYYEVLVEGKGAVPADTSKVGIKYAGTLIDGTEFDRRDDVMNSRASQFIPGFTKALTSMKGGSKWKVYIPQEQAYGARQTGKINPFSALIFELELVTVNGK